MKEEWLVILGSKWKACIYFIDITTLIPISGTHLSVQDLWSLLYTQRRIVSESPLWVWAQIQILPYSQLIALCLPKVRLWVRKAGCVTASKWKLDLECGRSVALWVGCGGWPSGEARPLLASSEQTNVSAEERKRPKEQREKKSEERVAEVKGIAH